MATTNLGRIVIIPQGTWDNSTLYSPLDMVRYGTGSYICTASTMLDPTNTSDWQLVASDGYVISTGTNPTNFTTQSKIFTSSGPIFPSVGTVKFYPPQGITVSSVYATIGTQSSSPVVVNILRSGSIVASVTLPANSYKSATKVVSFAVTVNDYLTVDFVSAVSGQDFNLTLVYS